MIVQIEDLFIETDNIVTLSPYSIAVPLRQTADNDETNAELLDNEKKLVAHGLTINGVRYGLFNTKADEESVKKGRTTLSSVIATLVNTKVHPVQKLNLSVALEELTSSENNNNNQAQAE